MKKLKVIIEVDIEVENDFVERISVDTGYDYSAGGLKIETSIFGQSVYDTINVVTLHGAKIERAD